MSFKNALVDAICGTQNDTEESIKAAKAMRNSLIAINHFQGSPTIKNALRLAPHSLTRAHELIHAKWQEVDFEKAIWVIPATRVIHQVPITIALSPQAIAILSEQRKHSSDSEFIFPSPSFNDRPLAREEVLKAFNDITETDKEISFLYFRANAAQLLNEVLLFKSSLVNACFNFAEKDNTRPPLFSFKQRRLMMVLWSQYLESLTAATAK